MKKNTYNYDNELETLEGKGCLVYGLFLLILFVAISVIQISKYNGKKEKEIKRIPTWETTESGLLAC